jgi:peptidoglycan/xylan/chitin deacetylase (PgdA/CDA1 family)
MSKKQILAEALYGSGLLRPIAGMLPKRLIILCYHRICPDGPGSPHLFDEGVLGPSQSEFERQVKWLKGNFDVLSESDILGLLSKPSLSRRAVAITFDDGYRDNYELAYPVLRAHKAPAIFFLCPGLMDGGTLGWWDLIAYLIKQCAQPTITLRGETLELGKSKRRTIEVLHDRMKRRPDAETASLLEELSRSCGVPFPAKELQRQQFMTWDQAKEVSRHGISIGSHTHTHRVLARLEEPAQQWELRESKAALERHLGQPVDTIAYPVGRYGNFTSATMRIAGECGYKAAFSFRTGENERAAINPYDIRRISAGDRFDAIFACSAYMPKLFTWN